MMTLVMWTCAAPAQDVLTAGYGLPAPSRVAIAPGQIITFYLMDFASGVSLPLYGTQQASAAGIEAYMVSTFTGIAYIQADIILVESALTCATCGSLTAVTLQIPMNMQPNFPGFPGGRNEAVLLIGDHISAPGAAEGCRSYGATCAQINVQLVPDQVHILRSCDSVLVTNRTSTCQPLIYHGDGSPVTISNPGKEGETLVAYTVGMGIGGTGSSNGPVPLQDVIVGYGFAEPGGRFGPAVLTAPSIAAAALKPVYAGMLAAYPGLYQVNFKVPKLPSDISRSCNLSTDFPTGGSDNVNLIVSIARQQQGLVSSYDYAGICVTFPH